MTGFAATQLKLNFPTSISENFSDRCDESGKWLKNNRLIFTAFKRNALRLIATGREHYGATALAEGIRLEIYLRDGDSDYKINNNVVGLLSRHFSLEYPQHREFFKERLIKGELSGGVLQDLAVATLRVRADAITKAITAADRVVARSLTWAIRSIIQVIAKGDVLEMVIEKGVAP